MERGDRSPELPHADRDVAACAVERQHVNVKRLPVLARQQADGRCALEFSPGLSGDRAHTISSVRYFERSRSPSCCAAWFAYPAGGCETR